MVLSRDKRPYKLNALLISEILISMNVATIKLFKTLKNNRPTLKLNLLYRIQCQDSMAITELKTRDSVVYIQKSLYIQTISFDEEKWGGASPRVDFFILNILKTRYLQQKMKMLYILVLFVLFNITSFL